ncbi:hypothetical protein [Gordonia polyisoprenivorans]
MNVESVADAGPLASTIPAMPRMLQTTTHTAFRTGPFLIPRFIPDDYLAFLPWE